MRVDVSPVDDASLPGLAVDDQDWISVSDLARERGVSRQAISKRAKEFAASGRLPTRGEGRNLRLHRPTFEQLAAITHDPAQDLRNRHSRREPEAERAAPEPTADPQKPASQSSVYDEASAREKSAKAALAEMELARRRGELIPASEIESAAVEAATAIAQSVAVLKAKSGQLYAAGHKGGEEALHIVLVEAVNATLGQIADAMAKLAARGAADTD